jgi:hypothetical protein
MLRARARDMADIQESERNLDKALDLFLNGAAARPRFKNLHASDGDDEHNTESKSVK